MEYSRSPLNLITTTAGFFELANPVAKSQRMEQVAPLIARFLSLEGNIILHHTKECFQRALDFYHSQKDKEWSLTDCLSFLVMQEQNLAETLTGDHHFEQAGFRALLM